MENISINIEQIQTLEKILKDFSIPIDGESERTEKGVIITRDELPVPQIIFFLFVKILKYPKNMHLEKTLWIIAFIFKGKFFEIAFEKFGLRLYVSNTIDNEEECLRYKKEILYYLRAAIKDIERYLLKDFAKLQISDWHIIIENQYVKFTNMYHYFREQASESFGKEKTLSKGAKSVFGLEPNTFQWNLIGFYNTSAMLDTFYSRLEHLLVLSLPFLNLNKNNIDLVKYISSNWSDKYKSVFDINTDSVAKGFYDKLYDVKEKFRNTYSHGGFEKDGASLFFHLPEVGAIPCSLSQFKDSPHFNFFPIEAHTFDDVCKLFDDFETWLEKSRIKYGLMFANSGIKISYDDKSILEFSKAMKSDDDFQRLIDKKGYYSDMYANMDF